MDDTISSSNPSISVTLDSIQCVNTARWTEFTLHFCEKLDGKVVDRNCFCRAVEDDIDAVPFMDGILYECCSFVIIEILFLEFLYVRYCNNQQYSW